MECNRISSYGGSPSKDDSHTIFTRAGETSTDKVGGQGIQSKGQAIRSFYTLSVFQIACWSSKLLDQAILGQLGLTIAWPRHWHGQKASWSGGTPDQPSYLVDQTALRQACEWIRPSGLQTRQARVLAGFLARPTTILVGDQVFE